MSNSYLYTAEDGLTRCWWGSEQLDYRHYHDNEWGHPVADDFRLFEKMSLEGFQSGLSWLTILRKRENFRIAFSQFDFNKVANFTEKDVSRLLLDQGIVRHRGKITATINNARCAQQIVAEFGSLAAYIWQWEPSKVEMHLGKEAHQHPIASITATSIALSKALKKRGWKFFGPTTAYAFMQAMGLVNDHHKECVCFEKVAQLRATFKRPISK
ncbi:DNA-3-methyladenine glycosylase I [Psychromonas sp. MME2]|uniref:DNA-3-methyladenine glycosylase I n=1 Tax=unclassified Psychromonas TaxID=2614957 RepID=UPI00339D1765